MRIFEEVIERYFILILAVVAMFVIYGGYRIEKWKVREWCREEIERTEK